MKTKLFGALLLSLATLANTFAQQVVGGGHFYGEDAFRFSNYDVSGSARMQGLGGNNTALGGDASNAAGNPAGLGFYNRSELSISPFLNNQSTNTIYQSNTSMLSNSNIGLGQASLVLHFDGYGTRLKSSALAISYAKQSYFPTQFGYTGTKINSSIADYFSESATSRGVNGQTLDNEYNPTTGYASTPTAMAYQAYLINPTSNNGTTYQRLDGVLPSKQTGKFSAMGVASQINISYGANFDDKTYVGGGIGIANVSYDYDSYHREDFTNAKVFNNFAFSDNLISRGTGINLKIGGIFKLNNNLQFGANFVSPTWYSMSETYQASVLIDTKANTIPADAKKNIATTPNDFNYNLTTPLRGSIGMSYFFGKKGIISADAEYVGYSSMKVSSTDEATFANNQNKAIQNIYKDVLNLKLGGELRLDAYRLRAGLNYRPNPYKSNTDGINHAQTFITTGAGYRSASFFIDLAGVFGQAKTGFSPYELLNKANYSSAQINTNTTNIVLSIGTYF